MPKFCGKVGYIFPMESAPGVYKNIPKEITYKGDITRETKRWDSTDHLNDNMTVGYTISILADSTAKLNYFRIKYVIIDGVAWKVTNAERHDPRIILYIGGMYNGRSSAHTSS